MNHCPNCGTSAGGAAFCGNCGTSMNSSVQQPSPQPQPMYARPPIQNTGTSGLAIGGFIAAFFVPFVGVILGGVALSSISKTGQKGRGLAIAAIVIGLLISVIYLFVNFDIFRCLYQGTFDCWVCQLIF